MFWYLIIEACNELLNQSKEMSLRNKSQCLVGVARVHLKQVEYLHQDCNDAFSKLRLKFKLRDSIYYIWIYYIIWKHIFYIEKAE